MKKALTILTAILFTGWHIGVLAVSQHKDDNNGERKIQEQQWRQALLDALNLAAASLAILSSPFSQPFLPFDVSTGKLLAESRRGRSNAASLRGPSNSGESKRRLTGSIPRGGLAKRVSPSSPSFASKASHDQNVHTILRNPFIPRFASLRNANVPKRDQFQEYQLAGPADESSHNHHPSRIDEEIKEARYTPDSTNLPTVPLLLSSPSSLPPRLQLLHQKLRAIATLRLVADEFKKGVLAKLGDKEEFRQVKDIVGKQRTIQWMESAQAAGYYAYGLGAETIQHFLQEYDDSTQTRDEEELGSQVSPLPLFFAMERFALAVLENTETTRWELLQAMKPEYIGVENAKGEERRRSHFSSTLLPPPKRTAKRASAPSSNHDEELSSSPQMLKHWKLMEMVDNMRVAVGALLKTLSLVPEDYYTPDCPGIDARNRLDRVRGVLTTVLKKIESAYLQGHIAYFLLEPASISEEEERGIRLTSAYKKLFKVLEEAKEELLEAYYNVPLQEETRFIPVQNDASKTPQPTMLSKEKRESFSLLLQPLSERAKNVIERVQALRSQSNQYTADASSQDTLGGEGPLNHLSVIADNMKTLEVDQLFMARENEIMEEVNKMEQRRTSRPTLFSLAATKEDELQMRQDRILATGELFLAEHLCSHLMSKKSAAESSTKPHKTNLAAVPTSAKQEDDEATSGQST